MLNLTEYDKFSKKIRNLQGFSNCELSNPVVSFLMTSLALLTCSVVAVKQRHLKINKKSG